MGPAHSTRGTAMLCRSAARTWHDACVEHQDVDMRQSALLQSIQGAADLLHLQTCKGTPQMRFKSRPDERTKGICGVCARVNSERLGPRTSPMSHCR